MNGKGLARQYELSGGALARNLDGVTDAAARMAPSGGGSSINWVVGHVLRCRQGRIFPALGLEGFWPDERHELYVKGTTPAGNAGLEVSLSEMTSLLQRSQESLLARLREVSDAELAQPLAEPHEKFGATVGELVAFFSYHESYHVGQVATLRRLGG